MIDVAVTGIDDQYRTSDEAAERPMQVRYDQKMAKYGRVAEQNNLRFIPAVFSHWSNSLSSKFLLKRKFNTS